MCLVAMDVHSHERVDITRVLCPEPLRARSWQCPLCGRELYVRCSPRGFFHFVHVTVCTCPLGAHPETERHLSAKYHWLHLLREVWPEFAGARVELEAAVPVARRIADILVSFPDGWRLAFELQLAGLTPAELEGRTLSYLQAGVDVAWVLGGRADTAANRAWCCRCYGFSTHLLFSGRCKAALNQDAGTQVTDVRVIGGAGQLLDVVVLRRNLAALRLFRGWVRRRTGPATNDRLMAGPAWLTRCGAAVFSLGVRLE